MLGREPVMSQTWLSLPSSLSPAVPLALGASVCWALANVFVARGTRLVGTFRGLLWAQVVGGALAAALALARGGASPVLSLATLAWLAGAGLASLMAYLCMFYALEHGRLSIAVPIMSGWSVISTAISVLAFHEAARPLQLAGGALVIVGVTLVSRHARDAERAGAPALAGSPALAGAPPRPRWVLASMGAAFGFGLLIPAIGRISAATGAIGSIAAVFGADILLGLPLAAALRVDLRPPSRGALLPVTLAGLFETAGFVLLALAIGRGALAVVSPLASLSSAMTVLYAWIVLRDRPPPVIFAGAALACAGVVVLAL
jgi:drug/metabolite transporter (DMT)-like permease